MEIGLVYGVLDSLLPAISLLSFLALLLMVSLNRAHLLSITKGISKSSWLLLLAVFIFALALTLLFSPRYYVMYTDEAVYMQHGREILQTGSASSNLKYVGWPFFISLVFGLVGESNILIIYLDVLLSSLSVFLVFLIAYLLLKNETASLMAAFLFALSPARIFIGGTAETNTFSTITYLFSIFLALIYYKKGGGWLFFLALSSFAFNTLNRPENFMYLLLFLFGSLIFRGSKIRRISRDQLRRTILPLIFFGLLIILPFTRLIMWMAPVDWASSDTEGEQSGPNWSIANLINNTKSYGYLIFHYVPAWIIPFIILGIILMSLNKRREGVFLALWALLLYLPFYISWPTNFMSGGPQRFFLSFFPSLFIFAAFAFERILSFISGLLKSKLAICILSLILVGILTCGFYPHIKEISGINNIPSLSLELRMASLVKNDAKEGCVILAPLPELLEPNSKHKLMRISEIMDNPPIRESLERNGSCVLFVYELVCSSAMESPGSWPREKKYCEYMFDNFELSILREYTEKDATYRLYLVNPKKSG